MNIKYCFCAVLIYLQSACSCVKSTQYVADEKEGYSKGVEAVIGILSKECDLKSVGGSVRGHGIVSAEEVEHHGLIMLDAHRSIIKTYKVIFVSGDYILLHISFDPKTFKKLRYAFLFKRHGEWLACVDGIQQPVRWETFKGARIEEIGGGGVGFQNLTNPTDEKCGHRPN